jgi:arylsulfatase A-like enzyme
MNCGKKCLWLVAWSCLVFGASPEAGAETRLPNIIFIVVDSLRRDHVGCYNYDRPTTPAIDRIAAGGARCDQAVSSSNWTLSSVMSLFTSLPPAMHRLLEANCRLPSSFTTLAAELRKAGYETEGITSNPLTSGKFGFSRGFGFYDDFSVIYKVDDLVLGNSRGPMWARREAPTSEAVNQIALMRLNKDRNDSPLFLFLLYLDPHFDYTPPPPYDRQFTDPAYDGRQTGMDIRDMVPEVLSAADRRHLVALYDGEIRYTDDCIGALLEHLQSANLGENTITIVTSDHGEEFWEHGGMRHGHTLYDELVRVPLVIRYPGKIRGGTVVREQVSHLDIMPTVLDLAGLPIPAQCQGRSIRPLLEGRAGSWVDRPAYMESTADNKRLRGARTPSQKIVEQVALEKTHLFDLAADPGEQNDLSAPGRTEGFSELTSRFASWKRGMESCARVTAEPAEVSPRLRRQLQTMGYAR